jgi:hypothetical protein
MAGAEDWSRTWKYSADATLTGEITGEEFAGTEQANPPPLGKAMEKRPHESLKPYQRLNHPPAAIFCLLPRVMNSGLFLGPRQDGSLLGQSRLSEVDRPAIED